MCVASLKVFYMKAKKSIKAPVACFDVEGYGGTLTRFITIKLYLDFSTHIHCLSLHSPKQKILLQNT